MADEASIEDLPPEPTPQGDVDAKVVDDVAKDVVKSDRRRKWTPGSLMAFGSVAWKPHCVGKKNEILHVAVLDTLPKFLIKRLRAARNAGHRIHVALPMAALYTSEWRDLLVEVDADVYVVDDIEKAKRFKRRHVLAALADLQVPVSPSERASLGSAVLEQMKSGSANEKGRRLEALLAFVFGQVSDFRVVLRNHRNKSQEIDLTLQIDNFSSRIWLTPGKPLVLVEAKNRATKADQPTFSLLVTKIRTKRQSVRIGFLVSMGGFTADLERESLRYSESDFCVVLIGPETLESLIKSEDLDGDLEQLVLAALME